MTDRRVSWGTVSIRSNPLRVIESTSEGVRCYYFPLFMRRLRVTDDALLYWSLDLSCSTLLVEKAIQRDRLRPSAPGPVRLHADAADDADTLRNWPRSRLTHVYLRLRYCAPAAREQAMRKAALWQIGRAGSAGAIVPALQRVLRAREAWLDAVGRLALAGGKRKAIPGAFANLLAAKGRLSQARSDLSALAPVLDGALAGLARQLTSDGPDLQQQIVEALPVLDAEHQRVKVEGKWYDVGQPATKMLRTLFAAKGAWVGGSALGKGRHDKTRNRMPEQVRNIIESDKTQGYRIPALLPK